MKIIADKGTAPAPIRAKFVHIWRVLLIEFSTAASLDCFCRKHPAYRLQGVV
jgi:hypothetical protein